MMATAWYCHSELQVIVTPNIWFWEHKEINKVSIMMYWMIIKFYYGIFRSVIIIWFNVAFLSI